jgi:hypothetical protein
MGHGRMMATTRFGRTSMAAGARSGGASAPKITSTATVQEGALSPSDESMRGAPVKRFDGGGRQWRRRLGMGAKRMGRTSI